ncbi:hypothetical protein EI94DRAFT_1767118 [Lactarius quietus]|nr:hypothetical protein EI94DRAFT_1767118 [Lactarius quietus]
MERQLGPCWARGKLWWLGDMRAHWEQVLGRGRGCGSVCLSRYPSVLLFD